MKLILISSILSEPATYGWLLVIILFVLSFVGIVVPIIPSLLFLWLGFLSYHFFIDANELSLLFWIMMALFTVMMLGADFYINVFFVDQFGGSKWSKWGAIAGLLLGLFIYPPIGMIIVPLVIVFIVELSLRKSFKQAMLVALGTIAGFLSSAVAKVFLQIVMIITFFIFVIL